MTAKDIMTARGIRGEISPTIHVGADMPVVDVLPRLLDAPDRVVGVIREASFPGISGDGDVIGIIDSESLLEGLGRMIAARDDSSVIRIECAPSDYSASSIARAVEDTDTHLVDLWSVPAAEGRISVTLRVRRGDPSEVVQSLGRYGFDVVEASGESYRDYELAASRLLELRTILNV